MMLKTHLAIGILAILIFLPHITSKIIFIAVALISSILPDADTAYSYVGKAKGLRVFQAFTRHRGFLHSFSFSIIVSVLLAVFIPVVSLGFFLGYSLHIFTDSFTPEGIKPFWPSKKTSIWRIRTGGVLEKGLFVFFVFVDILVFVVSYLV